MKRIVRMAISAIALFAMLGLVGFGAKWGYEQVTKPVAQAGATPCIMTDVGGAVTPDDVIIRVTNGGETSNLAKLTAIWLRAKEFHVLKYGNSTTKVDVTTVIGASEDDPEVQLVLSYFKTAEAKGDGRVDHIVDVILATNAKTLEGEKEQPLSSVKVDGPVCLPKITRDSDIELTPTPTPTPSPTKTKKK
ncbi:MAG: LytR C-terminal domain-containing protein [Propionibacteriaceae bacterium]|jgi:hypothetical protein|nr:LytR C-terminal domain-containing protein [Propionibacteriaceae bacterium]